MGLWKYSGTVDIRGWAYGRMKQLHEKLKVVDGAVFITIADGLIRLKDLVSTICQNIRLYEPEQSLSLSQDEGEQC